MDASTVRVPRADKIPIYKSDSNCDLRSLIMSRGKPYRAMTISKKNWTVSLAVRLWEQLQRWIWRVNLSVMTTTAVCFVSFTGAKPYRKSIVTTSHGCRATIV